MLSSLTPRRGKHWAAMDKGAEVAWPERFNHDELSAIQHAMNLKLQDEAAFFAEYQNEPLADDAGESEDAQLETDQIAAKTNGMKRAEVPVNSLDSATRPLRACSNPRPNPYGRTRPHRGFGT